MGDGRWAMLDGKIRWQTVRVDEPWGDATRCAFGSCRLQFHGLDTSTYYVRSTRYTTWYTGVQSTALPSPSRVGKCPAKA